MKNDLNNVKQLKCIYYIIINIIKFLRINL